MPPASCLGLLNDPTCMPASFDDGDVTRSNVSMTILPNFLGFRSLLFDFDRDFEFRAACFAAVRLGLLDDFSFLLWICDGLLEGVATALDLGFPPGVADFPRDSGDKVFFRADFCGVRDPAALDFICAKYAR